MNVFIVDALRTPRGRGNAKGKLSSLEPTQLLAHVARELKNRQHFDTAALDEALIGCVGQTGAQGANVGRAALLEAGYADVSGVGMINRYCTSSLTALILGALRASANDSLVLAGGVEMISKVPLGADGGPLSHDFALQQRQSVLPVGIAADVIATREHFTREQCDGWAFQSQQRAAKAREGRAPRSLVAVPGLLERDETPRPETTLESLAKLDPAFVQFGAMGFDDIAKKALGLERIEHVHTQGNAPASCDCASIMLAGTEGALKRHGLKPRARIVAQVEMGGDHVIGLDGTIEATRRVLAKANLKVGDIDTFEVNESYAAPTLLYVRELGLDPSKVNPHGGAIALGHPMGATGGVLISTALDTLEEGNDRYGLVTLAGATGLASAIILERT